MSKNMRLEDCPVRAALDVIGGTVLPPEAITAAADELTRDRVRP